MPLIMDVAMVAATTTGDVAAVTVPVARLEAVTTAAAAVVSLWPVWLLVALFLPRVSTAKRFTVGGPIVLDF